MDQKEKESEEKERQEKERQDNLKMMKDPKKWGIWPMLPIKKIKRNEDMQVGFLLAVGKPIVYLRNFLDLKDLGITNVKEIMEKVPGKEYDSFDSLLDDGWVVD